MIDLLPIRCRLCMRPMVLAGVLLTLCACTPKTYVPDLATRPYPANQHTTKTLDIQCFRRGTDLEIVNSTARGFAKCDLWINQRYVKQIESLAPGATVRVSLWDFVDEYGQRFYAGGFFRAYPSEPVRLVEIQQGGEDQPMLGLISIRSEEVKPVQRLGSG